MKDKPAINALNALIRLRDLCSRSEKSAFDVRKRLKDWGLEESAVTIINQLKDEHFINDERFITSFIHDKIKLNKWGRKKVNYLLVQQGFKQSEITRAFDNLNNDEYRDLIFAELQKKLLSMKKTPSAVLKAKLYRFGVQRGYEYEIIAEFIERKL